MSRNAVDRRRFLQLLAGTAALSLDASRAADSAGSRLGLVMYCCRIRRNQMMKHDPAFDLFSPASFLNHCQQLGAGGMQVKLGVLDAQTAMKIRRLAEQLGLFVEAIVSVPFEKKEIA